jgi:SAM-dependent methyltransferase
VDGSVLGVDLSGPMLSIARAAAEGLGNVELVQADAQVYEFEPGSFDAAVSRMGCMFFADPVAAFRNIRAALRPGGRLALTVWQEVAANGWITTIDEALGEPPAAADEEAGYSPGPFSLADPALCASFLQRAGFDAVAVKPLDLPLRFGTVDQAQRFLATWMDEDLDEEARARRTAAVHRLLVDNETPDGVLLPSATWLVTARRSPDPS